MKNLIRFVVILVVVVVLAAIAQAQEAAAVAAEAGEVDIEQAIVSAVTAFIGLATALAVFVPSLLGKLNRLIDIAERASNRDLDGDGKIGGA